MAEELRLFRFSWDTAEGGTWALLETVCVNLRIMWTSVTTYQAAISAWNIGGWSVQYAGLLWRMHLRSTTLIYLCNFRGRFCISDEVGRKTFALFVLLTYLLDWLAPQLAMLFFTLFLQHTPLREVSGISVCPLNNSLIGTDWSLEVQLGQSVFLSKWKLTERWRLTGGWYILTH